MDFGPKVDRSLLLDRARARVRYPTPVYIIRPRLHVVWRISRGISTSHLSSKCMRVCVRVPRNILNSPAARSSPPPWCCQLEPSEWVPSDTHSGGGGRAGFFIDDHTRARAVCTENGEHVVNHHHQVPLPKTLVAAGFAGLTTQRDREGSSLLVRSRRGGLVHDLPRRAPPRPHR